MDETLKCCPHCGGNAAPPPFAQALVKANLPELCIGKRIPICRADRMQQEDTGQLRFA